MKDWTPNLFILNKESSIPIYVQLVERVQALVAVGTLKPGDKLPSIRAVAQHLRIDYNTVAKAYTELDRDGLIKTARGVGTHVTGQMSDEAARTARQDRLQSTLLSLLRELLELGYTSEEVVSTFRACLKIVSED